MSSLTRADFWIEITFEYLNTGLASGLILGFLLLLRPVTNRLLTPRQRVWLWGAAWLGAYLPGWYNILGYVQLLPVTLRDLITPRAKGDGSALPWYLPEYEWEGAYNLAFPGGGAVQVELTDAIGLAIALIYVVGFVLVGYQMSRGEKRLRKQISKGDLLPEDHPLNVYANQERGFVMAQNVDVYLCDHIPTSFVQWRGGRRQIFLQKELPEHRRELVLKHEVNHFRLGHCWLKGIITLALVFHWWNPIVWLAYFAACRDLELDCDECTIRELTLAERREYAHALVELGAGKQLWDAPLSFGECDAAVRVKALANWKPRETLHTLGALLLTGFLILFITGGPAWDGVELPADTALAQQRHQEILMQTASDSLVSDLIEHLREENAVGNDAYIDQLWVAKEGKTRVLCHLSDGSWQQVGVWVWEPNRNRCEIYFEQATSVLQPNLSCFERVF